MSNEPMKVSYTPDGDTIRCWRVANGVAAEVGLRLAYLDAPEIGRAPSTAYAVSARA